MRRPDAVADTPCTYCRYVGRKVIAPSIANPTTSEITDESEKTAFLNNRSGSIGSTARRSAYTNAGMAMIAAANRPRMKGEVQSNCVPPRLVARVRPPATTEMAAMPA